MVVPTPDAWLGNLSSDRALPRNGGENASSVRGDRFPRPIMFLPPQRNPQGPRPHRGAWLLLKPLELLGVTTPEEAESLSGLSPCELPPQGIPSIVSGLQGRFPSGFPQSSKPALFWPLIWGAEDQVQRLFHRLLSREPSTTFVRRFTSLARRSNWFVV
jgi:hypothetical protein